MGPRISESRLCLACPAGSSLAGLSANQRCTWQMPWFHSCEARLFVLKYVCCYFLGGTTTTTPRTTSIITTTTTAAAAASALLSLVTIMVTKSATASRTVVASVLTLMLLLQLQLPALPRRFGRLLESIEGPETSRHSHIGCLSRSKTVNRSLTAELLRMVHDVCCHQDLPAPQ